MVAVAVDELAHKEEGAAEDSVTVVMIAKEKTPPPLSLDLAQINKR